MILSKADNEILRSTEIITNESLSGFGTRNLIRSLLVSLCGVFLVMLGTSYGQAFSYNHIEISLVKCY